MTEPPKPEFSDHFSQGASGYLRFRPVYPPELVDLLSGFTPGRERVWDAGCGSGQLSVPLARVFGEVVATDASRRQVEQGVPHPAVTYRQAPAEASGLPRRYVDLSVSAQAAHWFDLVGYYGEVRRVTRSGGAVALITYGPPVLEGEVGRPLHRFRTRDLESYWPPERRHVEEGYAGLPVPFPPVEGLPPRPQLHMKREWSLEELLGYVGTWSAVRAMARAEGWELLDRLRADLAREWGPGERRLEVRWPLTVRAGRVVRGEPGSE